MDLSAAKDAFLAACRSNNLSTHTVRAYACDLRDYQRFVSRQQEPRELGEDDVEAYVHDLLERRKLSAGTARRRVACLRVFFAWLVKGTRIPRSPFARAEIRIRIPRRIPRALEHEQVHALLDAAAGRVHLRCDLPYAPQFDNGFEVASFDDLTALVAIELLYGTGVRVGELVAIKLEHINLATGIIWIQGKGNRERRVFLPTEDTIAITNTYLNIRAERNPRSDAVIVNERGKQASTSHVRKLIREASAGLSVRITPHMLRHSAATHLLESGLDIRYVQRLLGHESIATTQIYTKVNDAHLQRRVCETHPRRSMSRRSETAEPTSDHRFRRDEREALERGP